MYGSPAVNFASAAKWALVAGASGIGARALSGGGDEGGVGPRGGPFNPINVTSQGSFGDPNVITPGTQINAQGQAIASLSASVQGLQAVVAHLSVQGEGALVLSGVSQLGGISALQTGQDRERSTQENFGESVLRTLNL